MILQIAMLFHKQAAAVLTATVRIAAAAYRLMLRISTAHRIFPTLYNGLGDISQNCPFHLGDQCPHLIQGSLIP